MKFFEQLADAITKRPFASQLCVQGCGTLFGDTELGALTVGGTDRDPVCEGHFELRYLLFSANEGYERKRPRFPGYAGYSSKHAIAGYSVYMATFSRYWSPHA